MKKIWLLSASVLAILFAGCGDDGSNASDKPANQKMNRPTPIPMKAKIRIRTSRIPTKSPTRTTEKTRIKTRRRPKKKTVKTSTCRQTTTIADHVIMRAETTRIARKVHVSANQAIRIAMRMASAKLRENANANPATRCPVTTGLKTRKAKAHVMAVIMNAK